MEDVSFKMMGHWGHLDMYKWSYGQKFTCKFVKFWAYVELCSKLQNADKMNFQDPVQKYAECHSWDMSNSNATKYHEIKAGVTPFVGITRLKHDEYWTNYNMTTHKQTGRIRPVFTRLVMHFILSVTKVEEKMKENEKEPWAAFVPLFYSGLRPFPFQVAGDAQPITIRETIY